MLASMKEIKYLQKLMGTDLRVSIFSDSIEDDAYIKILQLGQDYENEFSRFLETSALSRLNKSKNLTVSKRFCQVFEKAKNLFEETNGVFNPLVRLDLLGYDKDFSFSDSFQPRLEQSYNQNFEAISFDKNSCLIKLKDGQCLDFGGFLKGFVVDEMVKLLAEFSGSIVNLGGDIACRGLDENGKKFVFELYNPVFKKNNISIALTDSAMATSGVHKRSWNINNQKYTHIVDPSKQCLNTDLSSVTVIGKSACKVDAYATTSFILGYKRAKLFLSEMNLDFIFIKNNGEIVYSENLSKDIQIT